MLLAILLYVVLGIAVATSASRIGQENALAGLHRWEWDVNGAASPGIGGFTDRVSYKPGDLVEVKIVSDAESMDIEVLRLGHYDGDGARFVARVSPSVALPHRQPYVPGRACTECTPTATWKVPEDAVSGVYMVRLARGDDRRRDKPIVPPTTVQDPIEVKKHIEHHTERHAHAAHFGNRNASHVLFVVRSGRRPSAGDVVFRVSDLAWATTQVSEDPAEFTFDSVQQSRRNLETSFFAIDYPVIRFLERHSYEVHFVATEDVDRDGASLMGESTTFVTVGAERAWPRSLRKFLRDISPLSRLILGPGDAPKIAEPHGSSLRTFRETDPSEDDLAESPTGVQVKHVAWASKVLVVTPDESHLGPWHGSRFARIQQPAKSACDAAGRLLGSLTSDAPVGLLRLSRTKFAWTYARAETTLHHDNSTFVHSLLFWRNIHHGVTFVAATSGFTKCLDAVRDIEAPALTTPWGTVPRRIHLEGGSLGADTALQVLLHNVLALAGAQGQSPHVAAVQVRDHVPCRLRVQSQPSPDEAVVVATVDDPEHVTAVVRVRSTATGTVELRPDASHPNERVLTFSGSVRAARGDRIQPEEIECVVVTRDGYFAPRSTSGAPSSSEGDL